MSHPFERYGRVTDLAAMSAASEKSLRKSIRVNTLKMSVEEVLAWGKEKNWIMEPVPWCKEAFFIDRENREQALGKDLLHLFGSIYMQEAASMMPPVLLEPQAGEMILDMSAAPGSKTTQMAAMMQGRGVIIANDMQEKRLWTLKTALHRSGVTNYIMTKKVGQWFGKHMTERFDRVLCDAPCTAQGTLRKDPTALTYSSDDSIGKMAKLQRELLEAAIHAVKVGGRVVYSTCTLTPEENEEVIFSTLSKFEGKIRIIDPRETGAASPLWSMDRSIEDSNAVQKEFLGKTETVPLLRLWPHAYDTEGFFCAVIEKVATTKNPEKYDIYPFQEEPYPKARSQDVFDAIKEHYGTTFATDDEMIFQRGDQLLLVHRDVGACQLPLENYSLGLPFAKGVEKSRHVRITNEAVNARGHMATSSVMDISDERIGELLSGKDQACDESLRGDVILRYKGIALGLGLAKEGKLLNRLSRWVVQQFQ